MKTIEENIEITLNVLDGVQSIEVPSSLQNSLMNISLQKAVRPMTANQKWLIAASIAVMLSINIVTIIQYHKSVKNAENTITTADNVVYKEYFSSDY